MVSLVFSMVFPWFSNDFPLAYWMCGDVKISAFFMGDGSRPKQPLPEMIEIRNHSIEFL